MKTTYKQQLRKACFKKQTFPDEVLEHIAKENLWNIWVPKQYGGLELKLTEGLAKLQELARIDGSLGWTVTLCSGANYFVGNLKHEAAAEVFKYKQHTILGGSGGAFGTAKKEGDYYKIDGTWHYATGAPYLSHFTLNAKIYENGAPLTNQDGSPQIRSFILPKEKVHIIKNWNTIGLKASATDSFQIENVKIHQDFSFLYNQFYHPQAIFKIPFPLFADLTLWVNYIGMAQHFLEEAEDSETLKAFKDLATTLKNSEESVQAYAKTIEEKLSENQSITKNFITNVHQAAVKLVQELSRNIITLHPHLGIKAIKQDQQLHQILCDYFTATQHHIFSER